MPKKPVPRPEDEESHLKKLREELEMSQEDLARELGVSSQTISRWELGKECADVHRQADESFGEIAG
jgi:DNA-binding XRE family transcriptional regulator